MIRFWCSACTQAIEGSEDQGGTLIPCPRCGQTMCVPTLLPVERAPALGGYRQGSSARPGKRRLFSALFYPIWGISSPASMLLALCLFPLPWVQIQCSRPIGDSGTKVLAEQSGLQAAYGGYTENPLFQHAEFERQRKSVIEEFKGKERELPRSGWMILFPLLLVAGIIAGFRIRRQPLRSALLIACSALAGLVLFVQAYTGFPLERALPDRSAGSISLGEMIKIQTSSPTLFETHYTGWFWLTIVFVLGSLVASSAEWWMRTHRSS
jgi:hypothetical protein